MILLVCSFFVSFSFIFPQQIVDGVLAVVGNRAVLRSDVINQAQITAKEKGVDPQKTPLAFESVFQQILEENIDRLLVLSAAEKDTNIVVSYEEVNSALNDRIDYFVSLFGSKEELEREFGAPIDVLRSEQWDSIKEEILIEKFKYGLFSSVSVSKKEVEAVFNKLKGSLSVVPAFYSYSVSEIPSKEKKSSLDSLSFLIESIKDSVVSLGFSFENMAKKHSIDAGSAKYGGDLGFIKRGSFLPEFEKVVFSSKEGSVVGPVKTRLGLHLIFVVKKAGLKTQVKHILFSTKNIDRDFEEANKKQSNLFSLCLNDPGLFDSLVVDQSFLFGKNNVSGIYSRVSEKDVFPVELVSVLKKLKPFSFSSPFVLNNSSYLVFLYEKEKEEKQTLHNSWFDFENIAKNEKIIKVFKEWIKEQYKETYVEIFNF